jgi:hypothetical protein
MSKIFDTLSQEAFRAGVTPRTAESRKWFRQRARDLRGINRNALMGELPTGGDIVGTMQMFFYDPKTKDTLPYYDTFPLVVIVGPAEKGFYGLNLHYINPMLRAKMLDGLMDIASSKNSPTAKFNITYSTLKSTANLKYYKPCFKHYLTSNVKSSFAQVPATDWEIAAFLPVASFKKIPNALTAYSDSRKMIG